jgi:hypothetical protein
MKTKRGIWRAALSVLFFVLMFADLVVAQDKSVEKEFGWIKIETNLDSVYVVIDRQFQNARLLTQSGATDSVKAETGAHTVTLAWKTIHDFSKTVDVFPGETYAFKHEIYNPPQHPQSSYKIIRQKYNLEISSAEETEIYVNGEFAGKEKARVLQLHNNPVIKIIHPEFGKIEYTAKTSMFRTTKVSRYYSDNNNNRSWYYYTVPFWKQGYHSEYGKMTFMGLSYIALSALTYTYELEIRDRQEDYNNIETAYLEAPTPLRAEQHKEVLEIKRKKLNDTIQLQNLMIGGLIATYAIGVIDAFFFRPREGYKGADKFNLTDNVSNFVPDVSVGAQHGMTIGLTWRFQ